MGGDLELFRPKGGAQMKLGAGMGKEIRTTTLHLLRGTWLFGPAQGSSKKTPKKQILLATL